MQKCQSEALTELFNKSLTCQQDKKQGLMGYHSLKTFLENVQLESFANNDNDDDDEDEEGVSIEKIDGLMKLHRTRNQCYKSRMSEIPHFTVQDFTDYLYSYDNDILDKSVTEQHKDAPLSHYFINSSHNSFLLGTYVN